MYPPDKAMAYRHINLGEDRAVLLVCPSYVRLPAARECSRVPYLGGKDIELLWIKVHGAILAFGNAQCNQGRVH